MTTRPRRRLGADELRRQLEANRGFVGQALEQASGVPLATFGRCDATVEAELLDDAVVHVLLHHMNKEAAFVPTERHPEGERDAPVQAEELAALLGRVDDIEQQPPPDLLENLPQERMWILADIAKCGRGLARQRATAELRDTMGSLLDWDGGNAFVLEQLVALLGEAEQRGDMPVLFSTLRAAALRALDQQRGGSKQ